MARQVTPILTDEQKKWNADVIAAIGAERDRFLSAGGDIGLIMVEALNNRITGELHTMSIYIDNNRTAMTVAEAIAFVLDTTLPNPEFLALPPTKWTLPTRVPAYTIRRG